MRTRSHPRSQARLRRRCFGKANAGRLARPMATLSPSEPSTVSRIASAKSHP